MLKTFQRSWTATTQLFSEEISITFIRFIFCGILNCTATYLLYLIGVWFTTYQVAYSIAYIFGTFFSYYLNSTYTFNKTINSGSLIKYVLVYIFIYAYGVFFLWFFITICGINKYLSPILVMIIAIPSNFLLSRKAIKE